MPELEAGIDLGEFTSSSRLLCAVTTRSGRVLWANDALGRAFGPESSAVINRPFIELLDPYDRPTAVRELTRLDATDDEVAFDAQLHPVAGGFRATWSLRIGHDGLLYIVGTEAEPGPPPRGEIDGTTDLRELVALDHLTGTASRRAFEEALRVQLERCCREGLPLSVALVDLDRFKHYNDTYGHLAGDQCLITVARALRRRASRQGELVGRFGGDEFLILWPGIDLDTAVRNAERLRETVRVLDLRLAQEPVQISVSVGGVTVVPTEDTTASSLVHAADRAMYVVKGRGGDDTEWVTEAVEPPDAVEPPEAEETTTEP